MYNLNVHVHFMYMYSLSPLSSILPSLLLLTTNPHIYIMPAKNASDLQFFASLYLAHIHTFHKQKSP